MTHHGDQHVDEHDDDGDVVESEQEHADRFDDRRRVTSAGERVGVSATPVLRLVLDLDAVDAHQSEHRPEQRKQRPRKSAM